jgi:hypothetical protein
MQPNHPIRHGGPSDYRRCTLGPDGGPCDTCTEGRRKGSRERVALMRSRQRKAAKAALRTSKAAGRHVVTAQEPVALHVASDVAAEALPAPPGMAARLPGPRPARASQGPRRRRAKRGQFPGTMPLIGPPELRQAIAGRLADAARNPGQAISLSLTQGEGQDRGDFKREAKNVAAILREFRAINSGIAFGFEGYRDDDHPMCGWQYSAYSLWFGQREQESAPGDDGIPELIPALTRAPAQPDGSRAPFRYALSNRPESTHCPVTMDGRPCSRPPSPRHFVRDYRGWHNVCRNCHDKIQQYHPDQTAYMSEAEWCSRYESGENA